jgi:decaprenylphospho-beta-D-erythro-pentofuranosid-2-ulose 2-reductase
MVNIGFKNTRSILILGATSDIANGIASSFARENFTILLAGRDTTYLERIRCDLSVRENADARVVMFDATDYESHKSFYDHLEPKPDVCACVFGYLGDQHEAEADWRELSRIIDVNYKGAVSILNVVADAFARRGSGTILGISSVAGDRGRQSNFIYGSAKAAFTAYLSGLRNKLFSKGVHVATIKPGFVDTKMTEDLDLPPLLTATAAQVGDAALDAFEKKRDVVYVLPVWRVIMGVITLLPEFVFKRLKL